MKPSSILKIRNLKINNIMQEFNINKNSSLPYLEIELVRDGRNDYHKAYFAIQNADVAFSMTNILNGIKVISNAKCEVITYNENCEDKFKIRYKWKPRDTKNSGRFVGLFKITFNDDIVVNDYDFPKGELIVPINEDLIINVNDSQIKNF